MNETMTDAKYKMEVLDKVIAALGWGEQEDSPATVTCEPTDEFEMSNLIRVDFIEGESYVRDYYEVATYLMYCLLMNKGIIE